MSDHVVITGVPPTSPPPVVPPARLDINDFVKDSNIKGFSLYVQALNALMKRDEKDPLSWFQIAGIHGQPTTQAWEGVPKNGFFCAHGQPYFITWHRPYLALLEQTIQAEALAIAKTYTTYDKPEWIAAADNLRQPYWDWAAADATLPPPIVVDQTKTVVSILQAPGATKNDNYPNPFIYYEFTSDLLRPKGSRTTRGNLSGFTKQFFADQSRDTEKLLAPEFADWWWFATKKARPNAPSPRPGNSSETLHDNIHGTIGGFMGNVGIAAFDPIFWLHHCQIDRILEIWHNVNKTIPPIPSNLDLTPFWKDQTNFWKDGGPNIDTATFNYSYTKKSVRAAKPPRTSAVEWNVFLTVKEFEAPDTFKINFYFGDKTPENQVGTYVCFVNSTPEECENCRDNEDSIVQGSVDVTNNLEAKEKDLEAIDEVVKFLREKLTYEIKLVKDESVIQLPSLNIRAVHIPLLGFDRGDRTPPPDIPYNPYPILGEAVFHDL